MAQPLARLLRHASHHRQRVALASTMSITNKVLDLAPPVLIGMAVDVVVEQQDSLMAGWGVVDPRSQLALLGVLTVLIWGLESATEYAFGVLWRNLAQTLQHELRLDSYAHIQRLDMGWFADQSRGGLMAVLNDDINQLERFLDGGANDILQVGTTVVLVSAGFFAVDWQVAGLAMLPIPVVVWGSFAFQDRIAPRYARVREEVARLNAILDNNLAGIATIKGFTNEDHEVARVRQASLDYSDANKAAISLSAAFSPLIRMAIVVGFTATLLYGGWRTLDGALAVGAYSMLIFMTQRLLWPLTRLGTTFDTYQRAMASTTRVLDLLGTAVEIEGGSEEPGAVAGELAFEDVDFAYPEREPLLKGFNLRIEAGETVAIVGATGAGKSSLIRLLMRFYDPQAGRITLDGRDIRRLSLPSLRRSVGLVTQHTFLFPGSVADNLRYGAPDAPLERLREVAAMSESLGFIEELPEGFDTLIGEEGQKLSGGQRQRLAISRAVLREAPILVLDEATSAVDNETEAAIQRSLELISRDRTTLVIAHRLSTIRGADRIVVMDAGAIMEQGTHEELVVMGGLYARLWAVQTGVRT